ncbi:hypothetical protein X975_16421, partial [Stegodyphus mimosarum]
MMEELIRELCLHVLEDVFYIKFLLYQKYFDVAINDLYILRGEARRFFVFARFRIPKRQQLRPIEFNHIS